MSRLNPLLWRKPPAIWSYWIAILAVGLALAISRWPALHLQDALVSLFLCAVILGAWFGGIWPGLLATVLSAFAFYYFFLPPIHSLGEKPEEIPRLIIFIVSALFVGSLSVAQRRATESLRHTRDDLKVTVQELRNTNEALQAESRERKSAEESLRRSENYLAEAQRLTHTGSWAWRVPGKDALHLSEEWYRIYGFAPEEGLLAWEERLQRVHPEDRATWQEATDRAIGEKSDYKVEQRILLPDGTVKYTHTIGHPVLNASGDVVQFVGTTIDVTERKRAEEALREMQADLARVNRVTTMGELAASVAHEVNQPIAAAVTNAKTCLRWLTRDEPNVEEACAAARRIVNDGTRAAEIIKRIRLLFKKGTSERELVNVNEVIREMVVLLQVEARRYSILVRTELEPDTPGVMADRVQLQQVLMNLMVNGIDAMKDADVGRELVIKSQRAEDDQVLVSVTDTGMGLPSQQPDQVFEAFFTTKPHGTGMGLSISRSIVESHGGRLRAANNFPRGASFSFTLPGKVEEKE
ncbi:MAG TPA: ATP-binding protein [Candidatus Acidoferrum sp.]|nr:ATP-binding protein [Candidatus Acidoferrum sp.]